MLFLAILEILKILQEELEELFPINNIIEILNKQKDAYIFYNGNKGYVYTITNEYYSPSVEEYTKNSFNRKYELTGDFRGEWREVCDYAENDDEIVAVSDEESGYNYRLLSNSKRKLEKIGQELYDNHTVGCYEVSLI